MRLAQQEGQKPRRLQRKATIRSVRQAEQNWHRARPHLDRGLIVVEGPFDAMRVRQAQHPNVVALLGTELSPPQ